MASGASSCECRGRTLSAASEMCNGFEAGAYLRLIDSCITQLKVQGPYRTCNERKEEEEEGIRKVNMRGAHLSPQSGCSSNVAVYQINLTQVVSLPGGECQSGCSSNVVVYEINLTRVFSLPGREWRPPGVAEARFRGTSLTRNCPPPWDCP